MGFISWLTGRDEKESDVYANYEKVDDVVTQLKSINTSQVKNAEDAVTQAINDLNNVKGVAEYVGTVNVDGFSSIFENITSSVDQIASQLQGKADDIKAYEESAWYEKLGSTFAMAGAKIGEGLLSVVEDIGDGVVSLVGWVAPKDSGLEKACSSFVEKDWSHDAFNFYYESDFAKKSAFTEDSALAAGFKIAGSTAGYLALGGAISGAAGVASGSAKAGKVVNAVSTFAKSTTRVNTVTAGLSAMGSVTETGLKQGLTMDEAAWNGAKSGAMSAALAYGMGKWGESRAKKADIKAKQADYDDAIKAQQAIENAPSEQLTGSFTQSAESSAQVFQAADDVANAKTALDAAQGAKLSSYQGYSDAITRKGQEVGANYAHRVGANIADDATVSVLGLGKAMGKTAIQDAGKVITSAPGALSTAAGTTVSTAKSVLNAVTHPGKTISTGVNAAKDAVTNFSVKEAATTVGSAVKTAITSPATPGVVNALGQSIYREGVSSNAATQFRSTNSDPTPDPDPEPDTTPDTDNGDNSGDNSNNDGGNDSNNNGGSDYNNNGGGGNYSNNDGGGSSSSTDQFMQTDTTAGETTTPEDTTTPADTTTQTDNTTPTDTTTDTTTDNNTQNDTQQVVTPETTQQPSGIANVTTNTGDGGTHTGGGYSASEGYTADPGEDVTDPLAGTEDDELTSILGDGSASIDDVIKGSKYTKIPTSSKPVTTTSSSSGASAVIPVAAGLSAAAAAGIGAKAYMDRRRNNDNGEDDEEFDTDEWTGDDSVDIEYDDSSDMQTLDTDDDYSYQASDNGYSARTSDELADIQ